MLHISIDATIDYRSSVTSCVFLTQVACALLMAGENLENHIDVKNVLVDMGIYFQVQVVCC